MLESTGSVATSFGGMIIDAFAAVLVGTVGFVDAGGCMALRNALC